MVWLQLVALVLAVLVSAYLFISEKFKYWKNVRIPCDEPSFPRGSMSGVGTEFHRSEIIDKLYKKFKDTSQFFGMYFMISPVAVLTDLNLVKAVLVKDSHNFTNKGMYYNERDDPLSAHLFSIDNPKWKPLRAKLTPTFTSGKMKMMFGTIVDVAQKFIATLDKETKEVQSYEIKDILARFTTDVIGSCAFGLECNSLEHPDSQFREMGKKALDIPINLRLLFLLTFGDLSRKFRMKVIPEDVAQFFISVVKDTVQYREKRNIVRFYEFVNSNEEYRRN